MGSIGGYYESDDLLAALEEATASQLDFIVVPLVHPRVSSVVSTAGALPIDLPLFRSDRLLTSDRWCRNVVGEVSVCVSSGICADSLAARNAARSTLDAQCSWADHLSLSALALPAPTRADDGAYASAIASICSKYPNMRFWLHVSDYETWDFFRVSSDFADNLLAYVDLEAVVHTNWIGEPIAAVHIRTSDFLTNEKGFPTLDKARQVALRALYSKSIRTVISGRLDRVSAGEVGLTPYALYVLHLNANSGQDRDPEEVVEFYDVLQDPLQPLKDHLHSSTYEVFEADDTKYELYYAATLRALKDLMAASGDTIQVVVVGAGRGPLIKNVYKACAALNCSNFVVSTVEKNPNAVCTLRALKRRMRWENLHVICDDARTWGGLGDGIKIDLLISELLGSWGDNELSPECLAHVVECHLSGICIPTRYTSYVSPIVSQAAWSRAREGKSLETQFVVKLHEFREVSADQKVFEFAHIAGEKTIGKLTRCTTLTFPISESCRIFGFCGTFESVLYADVLCSTRESTFSQGMYSWFELFLPIQTPISFSRGSSAIAWFQRKTDGCDVWYEWSLLGKTHIHNINGRQHKVGLS